MKYKNYTRGFYRNAVMYFYGCETKKQAEKILNGMSPKEIEGVDVLIHEFNNNEFLKSL